MEKDVLCKLYNIYKAGGGEMAGQRGGEKSRGRERNV